MADISVSDLLHLSVAERTKLAGDLWDNVAAETVGYPEQRAELDRRLADHEAHPETSVPWEEIRARLI